MNPRTASILCVCVFALAGCNGSSSSSWKYSTSHTLPQEDQGAKLEVSPASGVPGTRVLVTGSSLPETVCGIEFFWESLDGLSLGTASVENGVFSASISIPVDALLGDHLIIAQGRTGEACLEPTDDEAETVFTVAVIQPPTGPVDYRIYLKTRIVTPEPGADEAFRDEIRSSDRPVTHGIVQLKSLPRLFRRELVEGVLQDVPVDDVATLAGLGVRLLEYLNGLDGPGTSYLAAVSRDVQDDHSRYDELVRALVPLEPGDKVAPGLLPAAPGTNALAVLIQTFRDVHPDEARALFASSGVEAQLRVAPNLWEASVSPEKIQMLAEEDIIQWIEGGPLPFLPTVDAARGASGVDAVQALDIPKGRYRGLSGLGVQIGILDSGVDAEHEDLAVRIIRGLEPASDHGTAVASVAAGSGARSDGADDNGNPNGGDPFQWRGVAPEAAIAAYPRGGSDVRVYLEAILGLGVDVTNHSYVLDLQGLYSAEVGAVDAIARGDVLGIPARPQVWAAGNNADLRLRRCGDSDESRPQYPAGCDGAFQAGYFSILAPLKNGIAVGSLDKESLLHSGSSSLGPTPDGRLKPDISVVGNGLVAAGAGVDAVGDPVTGNGYRSLTGTSMAAPVVSGVVALMLQAYAETFDVNLNVHPPAPSTMKAILVHTATDLAGTDPTTNPDTDKQVVYGPGPDWATGYGLVNAEAAVELIRDTLFVEGELGIANAADEYIVSVRPGQTRVQVTLAWDDLAGSAVSSDVVPKLVNDLNLVLVEPDGTVHRPLVLPVLEPRDCDEDPSNGIQVGTCEGLDPEDQEYSAAAAEGVDRRNNVEMVLVEDPAGLSPGNWKARVSVIREDGVSMRLPLGGTQTYSIAGVTEQRADIRVSKTAHPDPVVAGESLLFSITVANGGPDIATDVTVQDLLPPGLSYVTDTGGCVEDPPGTITCRLGDLAPSESRSFTIRVLVDPGAVAVAGGPTTIANTVEVFSSIPDDNLEDNAVTVMIIAEDLADLRAKKICKPDRHLLAGGTATCTIFIDNLGPSVARDVRVTDTILSDGDFTITSVTASQGACGDPVNGIINCHLGNLDPASPSVPGRATVVIEITAAEQMDINDYVVVESATPDPDPTNNEAEDSVEVDSAADLSLTKQASAETVVAGTALTYTLTVANNGPSAAANVVVGDNLPGGLELISVQTSSGTSSAGVPGDPLRPTTCALGTIEAGASETVTIDVAVSPRWTGRLHNDARVFSDTLDTDGGNNLATVTTPVRSEADLDVAILDHPDPVSSGGQLTYHISITNDGPSTAWDVKVTQTLPEDVRFLNAKSLGAEVSWATVDLPPEVVTCDVGAIDPGDIVDVFVTVMVRLSAPDGALLGSAATVSTTSTDPDDTNNTATAETRVISQADLSVTKSDFPDPVVAGERLVYEIVVMNHGPSRARAVQLLEELPEGLHFVEAGFTRGDGKCVLLPPRTLSCALQDLDPGESVTVHVTAMVDIAVADGSTLENTATVSSTVRDPDPSNNTAGEETKVISRADLAVAVEDFPDPVIAGERLAYRITITNDGPARAILVQLVHELPEAFQFVGAELSRGDGHCALLPPRTLFCEIEDLDPGEVVTVYMTVVVNPSAAAGSVQSSTTTVSSAVKDPDEANNTVTHGTTVDVRADLEVTLEAMPDTGNPSTTFVYVVTVTNHGPSDARDVVVLNTLPDTHKVVYVFDTGGCSHDPVTNDLTCDIGTLRAGRRVLFYVYIDVRGSIGRVTSTADVTSSTPDPDPSNNHASRDILAKGGV